MEGEVAATPSGSMRSHCRSANYVTGEQLAADRLAAGDRRLLAIEVTLPERGSAWVVPGVQCRNRTEVLVQQNVQAVEVIDVYASEAELNYDVRVPLRRVGDVHCGAPRVRGLIKGNVCLSAVRRRLLLTMADGMRTWIWLAPATVALRRDRA